MLRNESNAGFDWDILGPIDQSRERRWIKMYKLDSIFVNGRMLNSFEWNGAFFSTTPMKYIN